MIPMLLGLASKINTVLSRLTATRAGYLDNLDATVSSRAAASVWTSALASKINTNLDAQVSSVLAIQSLQSANFDITSGLSTGTQPESNYYDITLGTTLTDYTNSLVFVTGVAGTSSANLNARLVSNTTLRIFSSVSATFLRGHYQVIEFT